MQFTEQQIKAYKEKHGEIFLLEVEEYNCLLHRPTRKDYSYVGAVKDPIKGSEVLLKQCWIEGDKEILDRDDLFLAALPQLEVIMQQKTATIKKL